MNIKQWFKSKTKSIPQVIKPEQKMNDEYVANLKNTADNVLNLILYTKPVSGDDDQIDFFAYDVENDKIYAKRHYIDADSSFHYSKERRSPMLANGFRLILQSVYDDNIKTIS